MKEDRLKCQRAWAGIILLGCLTTTAAVCGDVADDGRALPAYHSAPATCPLREVPLGTVPDWSATLERAVGGLAWGDADGDGDLDLAVGCYYAQAYPPITEWKVYVYLNAGGILETEPSWISDDQRSTADVRWADIDGDGRMDLIAANGYQTLDPSVVYFNGQQGLATTPGWTAGDATWTLGAAAADMDGDGDLDVAFANQGNTSNPYRPVSLFRNTGSTLETLPSWTSSDAAISNYVAWGDIDGSDILQRSDVHVGDGQRRLFCARTLPMEGPVEVLVAGVPQARFAGDRLSGWISLPAAPPSGAAVEIRYRNSSAPDLAVSRWANFASGVYGNTSGTLAPLMGWTTPDPSATEKGIGWADVDLDGDLDLAIGASSDPTSLYANDGGALGILPVWQAQASYFGCQDLSWGDVDGDDDLDLATIHFGNGHARVYLNDGGILSAEPAWYYDCSSSATAIAWGDMNGDGRLDLAVATARQPVMVFLNTGTASGIRPAASHVHLQVTPQPVAGPATIGFALPHAAREARLLLLDAGGRLVRTFVAEGRPAEPRSVGWDLRDQSGRTVPAGTYYLRLMAPHLVGHGRILILR